MTSKQAPQLRRLLGPKFPFGLHVATNACPWQNGVAERWVGSVRRELLDHVVVLNQRHLRRLLKEYVHYYHEDRTHLGLGKDTPGGRVAASTVSSASKIISLPRLGGRHHRYAVAA